MKTLKEIESKVSIFRPISQEVNLFDINLKDVSNRLLKFKYQNNRFNIWIFSHCIKLETPLNSTLLFSINFPDIVCFANKSLMKMSGIGTVFTNKSNDNQIQTCLDLLKTDLISLNFQNNEGITVYRNSLQLILSLNRQLIPEIEASIKMKTLIEQNFPDMPEGVDFSDLPSDLRKIIIKYSSFAITDDFERDEIKHKLTKKQRSDLIKSIEPKIEEINLYLDTFGSKPLTDGAIGLQSLCELVIELTYDKQ